MILGWAHVTQTQVPETPVGGCRVEAGGSGQESVHGEDVLQLGLLLQGSAVPQLRQTMQEMLTCSEQLLLPSNKS